jgi:hypothetical protein
VATFVIMSGQVCAIVGFERRVSLAFVLGPTQVVILRVLYAGRQFETGENWTAPLGRTAKRAKP